MFEKTKRYQRTTKSGYTIDVIELSKDDVLKEMAVYESKYGMTSPEFASKWNRGELDCAVMDYFRWSAFCDSVARHLGRKDLKIVGEGTKLEF